jgi:hypothetical protein
MHGVNQFPPLVVYGTERGHTEAIELGGLYPFLFAKSLGEGNQLPQKALRTFTAGGLLHLIEDFLSIGESRSNLNRPYIYTQVDTPPINLGWRL